MRPRTGATYRLVQGLSRGLTVLHSISASPKGWVSIADVSLATGLHRTTVRRMLETLEADGYVRRSACDDSYQLSQKVRQLCDGFTDDEWISENANPVLGELLQQVVWPSDLSTLDGDCMIVRETTHRFSPLSFHRAMIHQRMPLLFTAVGRAYLAYCGDEERKHLLHLLAAGSDEQAGLARNQALIDTMLEKIRRDGYAGNDGEWATENKVGAIAVPIHHQGRILACINVIFLRKAMSIPDAAQRYLPLLRAAVAKIESRLDHKSSLPNHGASTGSRPQGLG